MMEIFWRIKSKIRYWLDKIPGPADFIFSKKFLEKAEEEAARCEEANPKEEEAEDDLPDDFADIKLDKDTHEYNIKLMNIRPDQFKSLGRKLLNIAYADPHYGQDVDDDTDQEDQLPPAPEPSEDVKKMKYPLISVKATRIDVDMLEKLGDVFDCGGDYMEMGKNNKPMLTEPSDDTVPWEQELWAKELWDPAEAVLEEMTEKKILSNDDFFPGEKNKPYQTDDYDFIELCDKDRPLTDDDGEMVEIKYDNYG